MPKFVSRRWTPDDIAKLKEMAGKYPAAQIAAELGRGPSATRVESLIEALPVAFKFGTVASARKFGCELA